MGVAIEIFVSPLCLYELFGIIEKNEHRIYCALNGLNEEIFRIKHFRELKDERQRVQETISLTHKQITMFAKVPDQQITKESVKETVECFAQHQMDIFDKELARFCSDYKIKNIVTDDRDYHCVIKNVNIYTANRKYFIHS